MTVLAIAVGSLLVLFNGAFVALEFGLLGAMKSAIDAEATAGRKSALAAQRLQRDVLTTLGGAQLGITICSLVIGRLAEPAVASVIERLVNEFAEISETVLHSVSFAIALALVVVVHMVLGEMVPKNLAITGPERTLLLLARPMALYLSLARPVIRMFQGFSNGLLGLFRVEPTSELDESTTSAELALMVDESHDQGLIDSQEYALIESAIAFGQTPATSVMAQIGHVHSVSVDSEIVEIEDQIVKTGHTRLVVHGADMNDVRGFVHSKDLLEIKEKKQSLAPDLIRPMLRVDPESTLPDVLQLMRRSQIHMAVVTSEGTNSGVLTLDDVMRGLVGPLMQER
ncbi:MAG: HlyC/CorC family transporter [Acidimicrobiales bacterium]|nr:MAG: HlyC/CorC family transporter [Acidimicrobiales bacterium]